MIEIARAEKISPSYVARVRRMALLAPKILEAILDGMRNSDITPKLMKPFPAGWEGQTKALIAS